MFSSRHGALCVKTAHYFPTCPPTELCTTRTHTWTALILHATRRRIMQASKNARGGGGGVSPFPVAPATVRREGRTADDESSSSAGCSATEEDAPPPPVALLQGSGAVGWCALLHRTAGKKGRGEGGGEKDGVSSAPVTAASFRNSGVAAVLQSDLCVEDVDDSEAPLRPDRRCGRALDVPRTTAASMRLCCRRPLGVPRIPASRSGGGGHSRSLDLPPLLPAPRSGGGGHSRFLDLPPFLPAPRSGGGGHSRPLDLPPLLPAPRSGGGCHSRFLDLPLSSRTEERRRWSFLAPRSSASSSRAKERRRWSFSVPRSSFLRRFSEEDLERRPSRLRALPRRGHPGGGRRRGRGQQRRCRGDGSPLLLLLLLAAQSRRRIRALE